MTSSILHPTCCDDEVATREDHAPSSPVQTLEQSRHRSRLLLGTGFLCPTDKLACKWVRQPSVILAPRSGLWPILVAENHNQLKHCPWTCGDLAIHRSLTLSSVSSSSRPITASRFAHVAVSGSLRVTREGKDQVLYQKLCSTLLPAPDQR